MGSVSLDLVFFLFVCLFFFSTLEHFHAVLQKLMRMVRSIKSDDSEDWCKRQTSSSKCFAYRIKTNNIIAVFFLVIFIQLCDLRKSHYLSREFRVKLHLKTDIAFSRAI